MVFYLFESYMIWYLSSPINRHLIDTRIDCKTQLDKKTVEQEVDLTEKLGQPNVDLLCKYTGKLRISEQLTYLPMGGIKYRHRKEHW